MSSILNRFTTNFLLYKMTPLELPTVTHLPCPNHSVPFALCIFMMFIFHLTTVKSSINFFQADFKKKKKSSVFYFIIITKNCSAQLLSRLCFSLLHIWLSLSSLLSWFSGNVIVLSFFLSDLWVSQAISYTTYSNESLSLTPPAPTSGHAHWAAAPACTLILGLPLTALLG